MRLVDRLRGKTAPEASGSTALIVGLGNPGREYAGNRHNIGYHVADRYASAHDLRFRRKQNDALVAAGSIGAARVIVVKPQTFMNLSGRAVQPLIKFYRVPLERVLIIFDDLDLPFGTLRLRERGGAGGHNGVKSIVDRLGSSNFARLRVGIGRPPGRMDPAAYVLRDFDPAEAAELGALIERATRAIDTFVADGIGAAMNKFNTQGIQNDQSDRPA